MRTFNEDAAMLVPGDLVFVAGAWDEVFYTSSSPHGTGALFESGLNYLFRPGKLVRVAR